MLVTHSPAYGVVDLGSNKHLLNRTRHCDLCQDYHKVFMHLGCPSLLDEVLHRVRYALILIYFVIGEVIDSFVSCMEVCSEIF